MDHPGASASAKYSTRPVDLQVNGWWSPLTTRLLLAETKNSAAAAWNILDGAMGEQICQGILKEVKKAKLLERLLPAKTQGESQSDQLLSLLRHSLSPSMALDVTSTLDTIHGNISPSIRGDKSLFLSREYRRAAQFQDQNPCLVTFIDTVQSTILENLCKSSSSSSSGSHHLHIDPSMTSVQLALYPGDGISGYPRHCDRGKDDCQSESETDEDFSLSVSTSSSQRIITAIYYLTDEDWEAHEDGGALRIFHKPQSMKDDAANFEGKNSSFTDILPYRDRLVVFRSDKVEHQVLPSYRRPRTALTIWFYGHVVVVDKPPKKPDSTIRSTSAHETLQELTKDDPFDSRKTRRPVAGPPPLSIHKHTMSDLFATGTIFVSIASFRDSETLPTLKSLLEQAQYPHRIVVGLVLQWDGSDENDLAMDSAIESFVQSRQGQYPGHIRILKLPASQARGPCYARALGQSLHRSEDYYLQLDSHMRVRANWDSYLIQVLEGVQTETQNTRSFLSTYPVGYLLPNTIPNETRGTLVVPWKFDSNGLLRQRGRLLHARQECVRTPLVSAGFWFGPGQVVWEVPYDPYLDQLFFGEEPSWSVRLFTHGYDGYAPPQSVCYHLWSRDHRPTHKPVSESDRVAREASLAVVQAQLLGTATSQGKTTIPSKHHRYGLGNQRSLKDYQEALGVNFATRIIERGSELGSTGDTRAFVPTSSAGENLHPPDSLEHKVMQLDTKSRDLIAGFLAGVS